MDIVLLDDETYVLNGITKLLRNTDYKIIGCYTEAKSLLGELYKGSVNPQVIIADIKMPLMDGLTFMGEVRKFNPDVYLVILSGHSEFHFAQLAIEHRVYRYLLKPLEIQDLFDCLECLQIKLSSESELGEVKESTLDYLLYNAIVGNSTADISNMPEPCACQVVYFYLLGSSHELNQRLLQLCKQHNLGNRFLMISEQHAVLLTFSFEKEDLSSFMFDLYNISSFYMAAGLSGIYQNFNFLSTMVSEAEKSISCKIIDNQKTHYYPELNIAFPMPDHDFCNELAISCSRGIIAETEEHARMLVSKSKSPQQLIANITQNCRQLSQYITSMSQPTKDKIQCYLSALRHFETFSRIEEVESFFIRSMALIAEAFSAAGENDSNTRDKVQQAVRYIHSHYNQDISLQNIAEYLNLNANYFSNLFRKKMGVGFIEYIIEYRIRKAKEMLLHSNSKVHEIGRMVGFNQSKYFTQTFKKMVGITPAKYRQYALNISVNSNIR